ncbi:MULTISPECIES: ABC transporter ATP-binding protein [Cytobacillus]|uniref:ABC transporter ATP-binding protein n=1 Tax=Cytobacillus TaxID=2675230 RepID=UPI001CD38900|nr:ATP-binding cassette domain-containing protein [Cytobacillus kochii]MCA1027961.1 ATP-binding cassette domain-containing protein [Cytobacillus kochii]MCM3323872.1 ATP-binding cassette domain-containing protein [Cytobacillus kochii]MCM3346269.1 ATP-binding cassette domain-containing protein [Cytobacillus kochii]MDM5205873.1 ATP-binding cassette domain-containing protein [Cytobacillus kochii]
MNSIIKLEIQKKTFKKKDFSILNDFDLEVKPGERLSIIGESGVGKTSLLNILGLLDTDYQGNYKLFDSPVNDLSRNKLAEWRNQKIGFVLQESSLINSLTIEDNIKLPLMYGNVEKDLTVQERFKRITNKIGIESILEKKPLDCSGGQRSRAVFARAVIMNPQIILSDEPTASLDLENKNKIINLLFDMNKEFNTTIITVTHDLDVANRHERIITLERNE